jgi:hypothetical protein
MQILSASGTASGTTLALGGMIDLAFIAPVAGGSATINTATDVLTVTQGQAVYTQQLAGDYAGLGARTTADGTGTGTLVTLVACYCAGTRIRTPDGERAIEHLAIGDLVVTVSGRVRPVKWVGRRSYRGRALLGRRHLLPIRFKAGALGGGSPVRDLLVSPLHAMLLDDLLVPAWLLVNGVTIVAEHTCREVEYLHIELASHDAIWAEGAASETFVDDDSRFIFHNADEYAALYGSPLPTPPRYCARRVEGGPELEAIRRRLAAVARETSFLPALNPETD